MAHSSIPAHWSPRGRRPPRHGARPLALVLLVLVALGLTAAPVAAGPPIHPDGTPEVSLEAAMAGQVPGLHIEIVDDGLTALFSIQIALIAENTTNAPVDLVIEPGTTLEPSDAENQTLAVAGARDSDYVDKVSAGDTPTITLPTGSSSHQLVAFCAQEDDWGVSGPYTFGEVAAEPLPTVMENILAQEPSDFHAQEAVWWVTDRPVIPVPFSIEPLLAGVDTSAFAADPVQVVEDPDYKPQFAAGQSSWSSGLPFGQDRQAAAPGIGTWVVLAMLVAAAGAFIFGLTRTLRSSQPAPAAIDTSSSPGLPGWHPDPWRVAPYRWWDGQRWSSHVR